MFILLLLEVLAKKGLAESHGGIEDISTLAKDVEGIKLLDLGAGKGFSIEHEGRKLSFATKDDDRVKKVPEVFSKFEAPYADMVEISTGLRNLDKESEYGEIKRGGRSFAIFFLDEESLPKLETRNIELKIFLSTDRELAGKMKAPFPGIYGYNSNDKIEYTLKVQNNYFQAANSVLTPIMDVITNENMDLYEKAENPTFYILAGTESHKKLKEEFRETALNLKNQVQLCLMEYQRGRTRINTIGLVEEDLPAILIIENSVKYREAKVTPSKAVKFITDFLNSNLKPFILSGTEPADNAERDVKVIVYNNREKWLEDKKRDKLVIFQAPWCRFCKELKPIIDKLGSMAQTYAKDTVMVGTVDMTENEMPGFDVKGYPTIYLIKAKTNEKMVFSSNERTLKAFLELLKTKGNNKTDIESRMSKSERAEL